MLRRRLAVLLAAVMILVVGASAALAEQSPVPGQGKGTGLGRGGGDTAHPDDKGNHSGTNKGEGLNNNPHNTVC